MPDDGSGVWHTVASGVGGGWHRSTYSYTHGVAPEAETRQAAQARQVALYVPLYEPSPGLYSLGTMEFVNEPNNFRIHSVHTPLYALPSRAVSHPAHATCAAETRGAAALASCPLASWPWPWLTPSVVPWPRLKPLETAWPPPREPWPWRDKPWAWAWGCWAP